MKTRIKHSLIIYALLWAVTFLLFLYFVGRRGRELSESARFFLDVATNKTFLIGFHMVFLGCHLLYLAFMHFKKVYKTRGKTVFAKQFGYRFVLPIALALIGLKTLIYANTNEDHGYTWDEGAMNPTGRVQQLYEVDQKQRGMSVFGWSDNNAGAIDTLIRAHTEWVAVVPFMYQEDEKSNLIRLPDDPLAFTPRDSSFIRTIMELHARGLKVQLKPHLWLGSGWRSNISLENEAAWNAWFNSYEAQMLRYAKMAALTRTELFCVGTELRTSIKKQPQRWERLIKEIRKIYPGKLTYAANWHDEYEHVTFWDQLDFIGIQAYFPLTKNESPTLPEIEQGWAKHLATMEAFSATHDKPILFTEVGYKSEAGATIRPWEWDRFGSKFTRKKSDRTQWMAYEALFKTVWDKPWFAGMYVWEWDNRTRPADAATDLNFSPRHKPAENVIAKGYARPYP